MLNHYFIARQKIALVFIHGYCEDMTMWEEYLAAFEGHTILRVDLPGFGASPSYDNMSIDNIALEVYRVMQHVEIQDAILIGHSMGGYVAVALSARLGSQLKGLCMFHSHPFADTPEIKERRTKAMAFVEEHGSAKLMETMVPTFFAPSLYEKYADKVKSLIEVASNLPERAVNNAMQAMRDRPNMQMLVEDLNCPYHCILGTEDVPTPMEICMPQLTLARTTKFTVLEGIGHMGMFSAKEQTQEALQDFISYCELKAKG